MPVNTDLLAKIALNTVALILVTVETMAGRTGSDSNGSTSCCALQPKLTPIG
jgi:hypothetical protein